MSHEFFRASKFAERFKSSSDGIPLVLGGIHATVAPEECLTVGDIVVRGEGEHTFLELVQYIEQNKDLTGIPGICLRKGDRMLLNPPRPLEEDLDGFPFPKHIPRDMFIIHEGEALPMDHKLFKMYSRYRGTFLNITTTRGCPFSCAFCCNSAYRKIYKRYSVRKRSVESVISECVEGVEENPNLLSVNIQDDCFLANDNDWIRQFSDQYRSRVRLPFFMRTTPKHITREKITVLKKAGLSWVFMGLQSGSERINKEIYKRNVSNEEFSEATSVIKEADICCLYDIVLDNPYETEEDLLQTLELTLSIPKPFQFQLFSLCLYQGTELNRRAIEDGIDFEDPRIKSDVRVSSALFNQLIRMVPIYPRGWVKCLINYRKNSFIIFCIKLCNLLNIWILEPLSFLRLMYRAFDSNLLKTIKFVYSYQRFVFK